MAYESLAAERVRELEAECKDLLLQYREALAELEIAKVKLEREESFNA